MIPSKEPRMVCSECKSFKNKPRNAIITKFLVSRKTPTSEKSSKLIGWFLISKSNIKLEFKLTKSVITANKHNSGTPITLIKVTRWLKKRQRKSLLTLPLPRKCLQILVCARVQSLINLSRRLPWVLTRVYF